MGKSDCALAYMLVGRDVPYPPTSRLVGQVHEVHSAVYYPDFGSHNQAAMERSAERTRQKAEMIHGGDWEVHWSSPESEGALMRARLDALVTDSERRPLRPPCPDTVGAAIVPPGATSEANVESPGIKEDDIPF
jgi:hypothetical protein